MEDWNQVCFSVVLVGITFFMTIIFYEHYRCKKIDDLTKQNENLREEVTFLKKPVDELRDELTKEWRKKLDEITKEMGSQQSRHARELEGLERGCRQKLKKKDTEIASLQEKVTSLEGEVSDLEHVHADLENLQHEHGKVKDEVWDLKDEKRALKDKVKEYEELIYTREKLTGIVRGSQNRWGSEYDSNARAKALYDLKQTGLSYGEIAKKTRIKKGTVKGTIARYKKKLALSQPSKPNAGEATSKTSEDTDHDPLEH